MGPWQLYILLCLLALLGAGLLAGAIRSRMLAKKPLQFGQATVVALGESTASFELFDGQIITLAADPKLLRMLHEGDYGRLTYRGEQFVELER